MPTSIQINERGTMTLPKKMRKALGIDKGGIVIAEESSDGAVVLKPAFAFPIEIYSDSRVSEFEKDEQELKKLLHSRKSRKHESIS